MLLDFSGEICENDVLHVFFGVVLSKKMGAPDRSDSAVKEGEGLSGGGRFIQNVRAGGHELIHHGGAVITCPKVNRRVLGKAGPVSLRAVDSPARGAAMETFDQIERNSQAAIEAWKELDTTLGRRTLLCHRKTAEPAHPLALENHGAEGFGVSWIGEPESLGKLSIVKIVSSVLGSHRV